MRGCVCGGVDGGVALCFIMTCVDVYGSKQLYLYTVQNISFNLQNFLAAKLKKRKFS